jgi:Thiol-disulfide isomerase and thioredoxins
MKHVFTNLVIFIALVIAFSSLSGCSKTQVSQNETANAPVANNAVVEKTPSDFPPIPNAIAQADLTNLDHTTFKVADKKGKVILLNMWATWCGPCRSEMPTLVKMQDEHRDKNFEIIGIDTDDEKVDDINAFAKEMKLNYTLVWGGTDIQSEFLKISNFPGIPQSFLVDRDGHLRGVFKGANPSDVKKMEELVGKVVSE